MSTANTTPQGTVSPLQKEDKHKNRGQWTNQFDFFLSCLGFAVGLGNVWRFPYFCYRNGGGAFLIPYVVMLTLCGLPMFFMELAIGQYHGKGANILFKHLAPAFQGLGFAMLVVSLLVALYYNLIIAWTFFYLFSTFSSQLGWATCNQYWNTPACFVQHEKERSCEDWNSTSAENITCSPSHCFKNGTYWNGTSCPLEDVLSSSNLTERVSASEEYYLHYMLGISPSIEEFGQLRWQIVLCLFCAWLLVAVCLIKGVRSSGKVVYFTALFPYVVLIILLIRGVTLEGAADGIYFYIVPQWDKIMYAQAWGDAAVQIFYSLGPGFGGLLTLASYNKFNNNCYRDAVIIAVSNCGTSVFAGFVIFSILGFMAHTLDVPIENVIKSGPGLAFIAYPEAVTKMPLSQLWAFLFFFMLVTLGLDSQFTMCETLITAAHDQWPRLRKHSSVVVLGICFVCFICGLPLCAEGGIYLFTLIDLYSAGWSLLVIALLEIIVVSWIYGVENFKSNIADMIGHAPNAYWTVCWKYLSPLTIVGILIFSFINYTPASFGSYELPLWSNALGWLMALASVIMFPIFGAYQLYVTCSSGQSLRSAFKPTKDWGPTNIAPENRKSEEMIEVISPADFSFKSTNGEYTNPAFTEDVKS